MSRFPRKSLAVFVGMASSLMASHVNAQGTLEEVVVTAQRKSQDLFDVPVAVKAFSAEAMAAAGIDDISDLNVADPSFMATPFLSDPLGNAPVRIRGIGTGGGNPGFEGAVGLYMDDVYRSRTGSALLTFFDMAGVEVLRGPQGTLFGKNTTAGALLMRTAAPEIGETYGGVTAEVGNYGQQMVEGMLNLNLSDTAALRIAGIKDEQDGWFQHPVTGEDTFWIDNTAIRASLLWEPTEDVRIRLTGDYSTMESPGNYGTSTRINNQASSGNNAGQDLQASYALNLVPDAPGGEGYWYWDFPNDREVDPFGRDIAISNDGDYELEQTGLNVHVDWSLNENWSLRSITGWRNIESASVDGDWEFGPVALAESLNQIYEFDTFSQEILLNGSFDAGNGRATEITTGFTYFTEDMTYVREASVGDQFASFYFAQFGGLLPFPQESYGVPGFFFQDMSWDQTEDAYGVFAHVAHDLTDKLTLNVGGRFNSVEKDIVADNRAAATQDDYHDLMVANSAFFYAVGAALMSPDWEAETKDEEWTYLVSAQYRPNEDHMIYGSYSRGFKAGGFNQTENAVGQTPGGLLGSGIPDENGRFFTPAANPVFGPEFVDAYEIGWRWTINSSARLSVTAFFADYEDLQVSVFNGLAFEVQNAGTSESKGLEFEFDWAVSDELTLTAGGTFLRAEYGDEQDAGLPAGRQRGLSPEESFVLGARYEKPISNNANLYFNANVSYASELFLAEGNSEPLVSTTQGAYTVVGSTLGLRIGDSWDAALFCQNCFDEEYYEYAFNQAFSDAILGNTAPPRTYGFRLKYTF